MNVNVKSLTIKMFKEYDVPYVTCLCWTSVSIRCVSDTVVTFHSGCMMLVYLAYQFEIVTYSVILYWKVLFDVC